MLVLYCMKQNLISSVSNIITMNLHVVDVLVSPDFYYQLHFHLFMYTFHVKGLHHFNHSIEFGGTKGNHWKTR